MFHWGWLCAQGHGFLVWGSGSRGRSSLRECGRTVDRRTCWGGKEPIMDESAETRCVAVWQKHRVFVLFLNVRRWCVFSPPWSDNSSSVLAVKTTLCSVDTLLRCLMAVQLHTACRLITWAFVPWRCIMMWNTSSPADCAEANRSFLLPFSWWWWYYWGTFGLFNISWTPGFSPAELLLLIISLMHFF